MTQSYRGCALRHHQQHNPHPERGVPSDTSFSLCVSVSESLSPRVQGPPSAFREHTSSLPFWPRGLWPKAQSAGVRVPMCLVVTSCALLGPLPELSKSPPLFLRTIKRSVFLTQLRAPDSVLPPMHLSLSRGKPPFPFSTGGSTPFSMSPVQTLPAFQTHSHASSSTARILASPSQPLSPPLLRDR